MFDILRIHTYGRAAFIPSVHITQGCRWDYQIILRFHVDTGGFYVYTDDCGEMWWYHICNPDMFYFQAVLLGQP